MLILISPMLLTYNNAEKGLLSLFIKHSDLQKQFYGRENQNFSHTIAWNKGKAQRVYIDEVPYTLPANAVLPIMLNQSFHFERATDIVAWQFNREFYCIVNHDAEVGCVGFLFFGPTPTMIIKADKKLQHSLQLLLDMFTEEFESEDNIQGEMLRLLLAKLIIRLTREARKQYVSNDSSDDLHFQLLRQFNLLVETHFRKEHSVKFYADKLNKSPKTISNVFAKHSVKSPLELIQQRIITEAKRLFYYTDKSAKEIAAELGFKNAAHFSKFFKNLTNQNPSSLKSRTASS